MIAATFSFKSEKLLAAAITMLYEAALSEGEHSFSGGQIAGVVELVDTPDLGSGGFGRGGSSPFARTTFARFS